MAEELSVVSLKHVWLTLIYLASANMRQLKESRANAMNPIKRVTL